VARTGPALWFLHYVKMEYNANRGGGRAVTACRTVAGEGGMGSKVIILKDGHPSYRKKGKENSNKVNLNRNRKLGDANDQ